MKGRQNLQLYFQSQRRERVLWSFGRRDHSIFVERRNTSKLTDRIRYAARPTLGLSAIARASPFPARLTLTLIEPETLSKPVPASHRSICPTRLISSERVPVVRFRSWPCPNVWFRSGPSDDSVHHLFVSRSHGFRSGPNVSPSVCRGHARYLPGQFSRIVSAVLYCQRYIHQYPNARTNKDQSDEQNAKHAFSVQIHQYDPDINAEPDVERKHSCCQAPKSDAAVRRRKQCRLIA